MVTKYGPITLAKSFPFAGPKFNFISSDCSVLALMSFSTQNPAIYLSASFDKMFLPFFPIIAANSNSKSNFLK